MSDISIDEKEELLVIFMEECAEASVEASKVIRFGRNDEEVGSLAREVGDLMCMINLLEEYGLINRNQINQYALAKREKLKKRLVFVTSFAGRNPHDEHCGVDSKAWAYNETKTKYRVLATVYSLHKSSDSNIIS